VPETLRPPDANLAFLITETLRDPALAGVDDEHPDAKEGSCAGSAVATFAAGSSLLEEAFGLSSVS
jgi:hypothetical protein